MTQMKFSVAERSTKKPKQIRKMGLIPANVYGEKESKTVEMNYQDFIKLYDEAGESSLVYLTIEGEKKPRPVMIAEVQLDPISAKVSHVAFQQVSLKEKISAEIPVEIEGEFNVPGGVLVMVKNAVEVEALPTDLPENFVFSAEALTEIGQTITYKDLKIDREKVTLVLGEEGEDEPLIIVQEQRAEVEEAAAAETDGEETAENKTEGNETVSTANNKEAGE